MLCAASANEATVEIAGIKPPKVSVIDAVRIANEFVRKEKIDVAHTFIAKVRYVDRKVDAKLAREPYWEISYEPIERGTMGGEIWVTVGMDGQCGHEFGK